MIDSFRHPVTASLLLSFTFSLLSELIDGTILLSLYIRRTHMLAPKADVGSSARTRPGSDVSRPALVDVGRRYRLILVVCPIVGVAGLIVLSLLGYPIAGIALCAGLFMGFINSRMVIAQAAKFTQMENPSKRALTFSVLQRLGVLTAIALLIAFAFRPQGFTVLIGLAVFQLLMMGSTAGAMVRQLRG
jgi:hypothetical protein